MYMSGNLFLTYHMITPSELHMILHRPVSYCIIRSISFLFPGCLGCPAYTATACGLETHYVDSGYAGSYNTDNGNRKPSWEKKGYGPDDTVTDWAM